MWGVEGRGCVALHFPHLIATPVTFSKFPLTIMHSFHHPKKKKNPPSITALACQRAHLLSSDRGQLASGGCGLGTCNLEEQRRSESHRVPFSSRCLHPRAPQQFPVGPSLNWPHVLLPLQHLTDPGPGKFGLVPSDSPLCGVLHKSS